jgi:hypothetical protein
MTREWLDAERERLMLDRSWASGRRQAWDGAESALMSVLASSAEDEG